MSETIITRYSVLSSLPRTLSPCNLPRAATVVASHQLSERDGVNPQRSLMFSIESCCVCSVIEYTALFVKIKKGYLGKLNASIYYEWRKRVIMQYLIRCIDIPLMHFHIRIPLCESVKV